MTEAQHTPAPQPPKAWRSPRLLVAFALIAAALLAGDLMFKSWAFRTVAGTPVTLNAAPPHEIPHHQPTTVVPNVLALQLTLNEGALFGLGQGYRWLFIVISVVAVAVIGSMFATATVKQRWTHAALALVLAGALGNMVDRVLYGAVRDMLYLFPGVKLPFGWAWTSGPNGDDLYPWIFNLADVYLVVGLAILAVTLVFAKKKPVDETD